MRENEEKSVMFSKEEGFNYQLNRCYRSIGESAYDDIMTIGSKVLTIAEYIEEFLKLAEIRESEGEIKKAAYYYRAAKFYIAIDDSRKQVIRKKFLELIRKVFNISEDERFEVPYDDGFLPAYKFTVQKSKGTIVLFGGYDSYIEDLTSNFKYFNNAGYNVIAFEGPGQGSALEDYNLNKIRSV